MFKMESWRICLEWIFKPVPNQQLKISTVSISTLSPFTHHSKTGSPVFHFISSSGIKSITPHTSTSISKSTTQTPLHPSIHPSHNHTQLPPSPLPLNRGSTIAAPNTAPNQNTNSVTATVVQNSLHHFFFSACCLALAAASRSISCLPCNIISHSAINIT